MVAAVSPLQAARLFLVLFITMFITLSPITHHEPKTCNRSTHSHKKKVYPLPCPHLLYSLVLLAFTCAWTARFCFFFCILLNNDDVILRSDTHICVTFIFEHNKMQPLLLQKKEEKKMGKAFQIYWNSKPYFKKILKETLKKSFSKRQENLKGNTK